jgi:hypothetical protein
LHAKCEGFSGVKEDAPMLWYNPARPERLGLPAPVTTLIEGLA